MLELETFRLEGRLDLFRSDLEPVEDILSLDVSTINRTSWSSYMQNLYNFLNFPINLVNLRSRVPCPDGWELNVGNTALVLGHPFIRIRTTVFVSVSATKCLICVDS